MKNIKPNHKLMSRKKNKILLNIMLFSFFCFSFYACSKIPPKQKEIKIGVLMPFSGKIAKYGTIPKDGAKLFIDEYNKENKLLGIKIKLIDYNDEGEANKSVTGFNKLYDDGVIAVITGAASVPSLAVSEASRESGMPIILTTASNEEITYNSKKDVLNENIFRICFTDSFQGIKMASFINEYLGVKKVSVLYCNEDDYSTTIKEAFEKRCKQLGIDVISVDSFQMNATDFQSQVTKIASKKPDALFAPTYYETAALIAVQARKAGMVCPFIGADGWGGVTGSSSDTNTLEGSYYLSCFSKDNTDETSKNFANFYKEKTGKDANMFSASGYDAAKILVNAMENALSMGFLPENKEFKEAMINSIKKTDLDCVTGHITFDEHNNPRKQAVIIKISNGSENFWCSY